MVLTRDDVIGSSDLPLTVQDREVEGDRETNLAVAVEGLERRMIREALARSDGVQTRAAELLGVSERRTPLQTDKIRLSGRSLNSRFGSAGSSIRGRK